MGGMALIGLLMALPLMFLIGSDDGPEEEREPLGSDDPDNLDNRDGSAAQLYDLQAGNDTVFGGLGDDTILGGDGADSITDVAGNNSIDGGTGHDRITAGSGSTVTGGDGVDSFGLQLDADATEPLVITDFTPGEDTLGSIRLLVEGDQSGTITLAERADGSGVNVVFNEAVLAEVIGARVEDFALEETDILLEQGADFTSEGPQSDNIRGSLFADTIDGGAGDDEIYSRGNSDGTGDMLRGGEGNDTIFAQGISERGNPDPEGDGFYFVSAQSTLEGGAGDDVLRSLDSNVLTGGEGADQFELSILDDTLVARPPASEITDFVQGEDQIVIGTNRVLLEEDLSIEVWADGLGANIMNGDDVLVEVTGGQALTLGDLIIERGT